MRPFVVDSIVRVLPAALAVRPRFPEAGLIAGYARLTPLVVIRIAVDARKRLGPLDIVHLVLVFGMILGRGLEFRYGLPMTATGGPATPAHLRRYTVAIITLGLGIWIMAKLIADLPTRSLG